jgi:tetratricopeptide (TPR) repeat protein
VIQAYLAYVLISNRKWDEAIEQCNRTIKTRPDIAHIHRFLGWAYYAKSRNDDAVEELRKAIAVSNGGFAEKAEYAILLDYLGRHVEANPILEEFNHTALTDYKPSLALAEVLFSVGKTEEAFNRMEEAVRVERGERLQHFRVWPFFDKYRHDQRWDSLVKLMRVPSLESAARLVADYDEVAQKFKFKSADSRAKTIFDYLVGAFIEDYMRKRLFIDQSGWRSLIQIAESCKLPRYDLYSRQGGAGPHVTELIQRGLVETRTFVGHRGRGGEVVKIRIAYDREPTKRYVDEMALIS